MLAWAMGGSHTGHTTLAMRDASGDLFVCESTSKDAYWPTNGIQCTPWARWLSQAQPADFNLVWLPLSAEARAAFNETAAWEFINQHIGLNYGYGNLLWGWVDSESGNYPPGLDWQVHQLLPAWLSKFFDCDRRSAVEPGLELPRWHHRPRHGRHLRSNVRHGPDLR